MTCVFLFLVPMEFFFECMLNDNLLARLGITCSDNRMQLVDFFDTSFRFISKERGTVLSEFLQAVAECVTRMEKNQSDNLESVNAALTTENDILKEKVQISDSRSAELTTVTEKQLEGIHAFKGKVEVLKQKITALKAEVSEAKSDLASAESKLIIASDLCADIRAANTLLDQRLVGMEKGITSRSDAYVQKVRSALRKLAGCRKTLFKLRHDWNTWSERSGTMEHGRCGCARSIGYFIKTGIDVEWFHAEAVKASGNFQKELSETADGFRGQVSIVRKERDDALADNELYIGQLLSVREEVNHLRGSNESISRETCSIKSELTVRRSIERAARCQLLIGFDGLEKVCPVPTVDGALVSLADVYQGWMSGTGEEGVGFRFENPASGVFC
jgi:hypothetical protein